MQLEVILIFRIEFIACRCLHHSFHDSQCLDCPLERSLSKHHNATTS